MASDSFKNLITTFIILALLLFLVVAFTGRMLDHYEIENEVIEDRLKYSEIEAVLNDTNETAHRWQSLFEKQNIFSIIAGIVVTGIFDLARTMFQFITTPFNLFSLLAMDILQIPEIIFHVITFLIIVGAIFGIWSLLKKGD